MTKPENMIFIYDKTRKHAFYLWQNTKTLFLSVTKHENMLSSSSIQYTRNAHKKQHKYTRNIENTEKTQTKRQKKYKGNVRLKWRCPILRKHIVKKIKRLVLEHRFELGTICYQLCFCFGVFQTVDLNVNYVYDRL